MLRYFDEETQEWKEVPVKMPLQEMTALQKIIKEVEGKIQFSYTQKNQPVLEVGDQWNEIIE